MKGKRNSGLAVLEKYGIEHYSRIGSLPPKPGSRRRGRPTKKEACALAWIEWEKQNKRTRRGAV